MLEIEESTVKDEKKEFFKSEKMKKESGALEKLEQKEFK